MRAQIAHQFEIFEFLASLSKAPDAMDLLKPVFVSAGNHRLQGERGRRLYDEDIAACLGAVRAVILEDEVGRNVARAQRSGVGMDPVPASKESGDPGRILAKDSGLAGHVDVGMRKKLPDCIELGLIYQIGVAMQQVLNLQVV